MKNPIFITGVSRSGTSLTAGIINKSGAFGGEMTGTTRFNPKGQFENSEIRDKIIKPYLLSIKADPLGQNPLPITKELTPVENWSILITNAIFKNELNTNQRWFYKEPKMCLLWPLFHSAFPDAQWIVVRRDKEKIAESCMRTSFMRVYNTKKEWIKWVEYYEERFKEMKKHNLNIMEIHPYEASYEINFFREMIAFLNLTWNERETINFIDRSLWNTQK